MNLNAPVFSLSSIPRRKAAIGLTSLIDVVFILLLFFMLSSSFASKQALQLQNSSAGTRFHSDEIRPIVINVTSESSWMINDEACENQECLLLKLNSQKTSNKDIRIAVRAEGEATIQSLVSTIELLERRDYSNVTLIPSVEADHAKP